MLDALIMDMATAQALRDATAGRDHRLNPRPIDAGPFAGQFFLPARLADDAHFTFVDFSSCGHIAQFDPATAWPPEEGGPPEEGAEPEA